MYDYPLPTASSTPPSPLTSRRHHHHHHKRSQSPLPQLATLLPANHHHHHHQYSPSTRAADISRLLDPAYASSSSSSSMCPTPSPQSQPRAYVDHNGDLHDPDYRDFPVLAARPNSRASDNHKRRRTSASSAARSRSHDRYSIGMHPPRPKWERDWGTEVDSDEDDEYEEAESQSHFSPFASQHGSPRKHTSHSAFSRPTYTSTYYYFDAPPTGSPVGSLEDESPNALQLHESPFDDDAVAEEVIEESRKAACLIRRASKPKKSVEVEVEKEIVQPSPITIEEEEYEDEQGSTPTCSHILRQQWQAVTLRIRFGVFHAKRRLFTRRRRT